jgi:uncharacterized protein YgiM (DUF1202 family)
MRFRCIFFPITIIRGLISIGLFALLLSGSLVFAQDSSQNIGSEIKGEGYIKIVTKSRTLNVRQKASSRSPVIGSLPNGSQVPFTGVTADDTVNLNGFWYQVEYVNGKLGWVSGSYSEKIPASKKLTTSLTAKQENNELNQVEEKKPVTRINENNVQNELQPNEIVKTPATETKKDSAQVESKGFFKNLFSSKPKQKIKNPVQNEQSTTGKPLASIDGFRSAKFGMGRAEVTKAIFKDFGIASGKIAIISHPTEHTQSLGISIDNLLPNAGKSQAVYVFGYKSKRLMQVNIVTGHPFDKDVTPQQVVNAGNLLGNHFFKKRYQEDGLVAHARLSDGSVLIFRGKDQKGRMALLRLSNPQPNAKKDDDLKITLTLSYIEKPGQPDTYQLNEKDF